MSAIEQGAGRGQLLYFDCFGGLAGDMIVAALIDLGVPLAVIERAAAALPVSGYRLRLETVERNAVVARRFVVEVDEAAQPHRSWREIERLLRGAELDEAVRELALGIFGEIAAAEARIHGTDLDHVHFHEVGAVDSIIDIVGAAAALAHVGARVVCAPVPLGHGFVQTRHGTLPVPAPATLLILEGVPVVGTAIEAELTTPTGAAVVKRAAASFGRYPALVPRRVGFGAGTRTTAERPGLLRVVLGEPPATAGVTDTGSCVVIEANVDDVTGEVAAHAAQQLLAAGALDAWIEPIQMKKGRPALKLAVLADRARLEQLAAVLLAETPTIGLRHYPVGRIEMQRSLHEVETPYGLIRVKVARGPGGAVNAAPEFEDCRAAAARHGVPLKQVMAVAAGHGQRLLEDD